MRFQRGPAEDQMWCRPTATGSHANWLIDDGVVRLEVAFLNGYGHDPRDP